ncbi:MAG: hypothetical protein GF388_01400 [Candidatus Aegiribacteria sp.]|nr:hypothetical protein [Candidatus Aegiribacteria sp.]MBD3294034.1 hypothetical protein [Candidatus Fermentibacteria bacterium]
MKLLDRLFRRNRAEGYPGKGLLGKPAPGKVAGVSPETCIGCGECSVICFYKVIRVRRNGKARVGKGCSGCAACFRICSSGAIRMVENN